jgi:hypothetical protein
MNNSDQANSLDQISVTIEGEEDSSTRPWKGPPSIDRAPIDVGTPGFSREFFHIFIINDEDLTIRPWRRTDISSTGSGTASIPAVQ